MTYFLIDHLNLADRPLKMQSPWFRQNKIAGAAGADPAILGWVDRKGPIPHSRTPWRDIHIQKDPSFIVAHVFINDNLLMAINERMIKITIIHNADLPH